MFKNINNIVSDILYVSKITKTNKKKITISFSVGLTQVIAFTDILIILFFTSLFTDADVVSYEIGKFIKIFEFKILLPLIITFRYYAQYLQSVVLKRLEFQVQMNLRDYILTQVFENRNFSTADTYYFVNTVAVHISFFYTSIANFLNFLLQSMAFTLYLFLTDPKTISSFFIGILLLIYPIFYLIKKSRQYEHLIYVTGQEASKEVQRILDNVFLIKLLKKEKNEISRYSNLNKSLYNDLMTKHKITILNSYLAPYATVFLISIIALFFNEFFNITLSFMGVTLRMFQSFASMSNSANSIINSQVHLGEFYKLEKFKTVELKDNYIILDEPENELLFEVRDVSFNYLVGDYKIFSDLNFSIKKGTHTIISGTNGTGKSTLIGLLAGVYYPNEGTVIARTNKLGFVGPNPLIFSATLKDNLMYGNNTFKNDEEIINLINKFKLFENDREVNLQKLIDNKSLSSGQMQKIAFMRVLLSDAEVLFLDESTSNLDVETKRIIVDFILNCNLTIINSTHDLESFETFTNHFKIVVSNGKRILKKIV